ncbi:MAG: DUF1080 domain-containing protein [Bacteroidales bacterium]
MKNIYFFICLLISFNTYICLGQEKQENSLEGRWDITVNIFNNHYPAWLEVRHSGFHTLVGRIMFFVGSARPISKINFSDGKFNFSIPPQWDDGDSDIQFEGELYGDSIKGSVKYVDNKIYHWIGTKAPSLQRNKTLKLSTPITLFNGKDLSGWYTKGDNQWIVESGVLKSPKSGVNIISDEKFIDFKLHIEFRYQKGGNSGIYLRGRYEVQIADSKGLDRLDDQFGSIYGLLSPNEMVAKEPGEWQIYDIILIGRKVTIIANGIAVITEQVIPGITGGALDANEGEPGPIMLQGDHEPIEFRNIVLTPYN